jgi:hypothetical protein
MAKAAGYMPNSLPGPFMVNVVAEYAGETEQQQVPQTNVAPPADAKANHHHLALKILIGAAAVGVFMYILWESYIDKNKPAGQR